MKREHGTIDNEIKDLFWPNDLIEKITQNVITDLCKPKTNIPPKLYEVSHISLWNSSKKLVPVKGSIDVLTCKLTKCQEETFLFSKMRLICKLMTNIIDQQSGIILSNIFRNYSMPIPIYLTPNMWNCLKEKEPRQIYLLLNKKQF